MVKETRADDRAELKRLVAEHDGLPKFVATSADGRPWWRGGSSY
jgi:hypothetical protein